MTVQGPVKRPQPDGTSRRGAGGSGAPRSTAASSGDDEPSVAPLPKSLLMTPPPSPAASRGSGPHVLFQGGARLGWARYEARYDVRLRRARQHEARFADVGCQTPPFSEVLEIELEGGRGRMLVDLGVYQGWDGARRWQWRGPACLKEVVQGAVVPGALVAQPGYGQPAMDEARFAPQPYSVREGDRERLMATAGHAARARWDAFVLGTAGLTAATRTQRQLMDELYRDSNTVLDPLEWITGRNKNDGFPRLGHMIPQLVPLLPLCRHYSECKIGDHQPLSAHGLRSLCRGLQCAPQFRRLTFVGQAFLELKALTALVLQVCCVRCVTVTQDPKYPQSPPCTPSYP